MSLAGPRPSLAAPRTSQLNLHPNPVSPERTP